MTTSTQQPTSMEEAARTLFFLQKSPVATAVQQKTPIDVPPMCLERESIENSRLGTAKWAAGGKSLRETPEDSFKVNMNGPALSALMKLNNLINASIEIVSDTASDPGTSTGAMTEESKTGTSDAPGLMGFAPRGRSQSVAVVEKKFSKDVMSMRIAQGKVGVYTRDERKKLISKFLKKRESRIWKKRVKYDVRKNFADSRLRVKGRFVRKEDEEQLREFLIMTF
mmetsp:Transcript_3451/g.4983  ORF Transcript_3451/g.4983 Transcript_3451/m.4983 type:complete len:225 (+) Transcript_3451:252-926(+)|eukprot:CAMPEP_0203758110 /NCGR_PEP_ID=MMETSP0098-20131031/10858_1 /ASSEMBLY_ACC=CAM_ASM_000208 /TAXON_ID=96639 /ORGANISM=" , Strain NY0313808BC1" /LENGTH=224 /DNA_ID=CAMNT_0050650361 /DNA_START=238 /DNA_END=912 /DNA_ORIENTATION=-